MIYLRCDRHRSQGRRPLSACLCRCRAQCAEFAALSDSQVLEFLQQHPLPEPFCGYQLRLFPALPMPESGPQAARG